MNIYGKILILALTFGLNCSVYAQTSSGQSFGSRTEYSNDGLMDMINSNIWWWRVFSGFTNWSEGPENKLRLIKARANRSEKDAQELLVNLSEILATDEPAGNYIIELYQSLLIKSQKSQAMPSQLVYQLIKDRHTELLSVQGNRLSKVSKALIDFLNSDFKIPSLSEFKSKVENEEFTAALIKTLTLYAPRENTSKKIDEVLSVAIPQKVHFNVIERELFINTKYSSLYNVSVKGELNSPAQSLFSLRKQLLESMTLEQRLSIAYERVSNFKVDTTQGRATLFNYKKIEPDIEILVKNGGKETLQKLTQKIEQLVVFLEQINIAISETLMAYQSRMGVSFGSRSSRTRGGSSRAGGSANLGGSGGSGGSSGNGSSNNFVSSAPSARLRALLALQHKTRQEIEKLIRDIDTVCRNAETEKDNETLESCANATVLKLMALSKDKKISRFAGQQLRSAIANLMFNYSEHIKIENFETSCEYTDLLANSKKLQMKLEAVKDTDFLVERVTATSVYGPRIEIKNIRFVDCLKPEYAILISDRNQTAVREGNEGARAANLFFIDKQTVGSCINFQDYSNQHSNEPSISNKNHPENKGVKASLGNVSVGTSFSGEYNNPLLKHLSHYLRSKSELVEVIEMSQIISSPSLNLRGNWFYPKGISGTSLNDAQKRVCMMTKQTQPDLPCTKANSGEIQCEDTALFKVQITEKKGGN